MAPVSDPIRVRIGLNAGEPVAEDKDLFGTAVQLAARVCGQAQAGQILVPEGVRHLVAGKGFLFSDQGDVALLRAQKALDKLEKTLKGDELTGIVILRKALEEPLRMIAENAGQEGMVVIDRVRAAKDANFGYDAATDEYCDLLKHGIIDPAKVTRTALENASSIASLLLTTESLVTEIPEPPSAAPGGPPPMDY